MDDESRIIPVDREFYHKLMTLLEPDERWATKVDGHMALILWTAPSKQLIFSPKVSDG